MIMALRYCSYIQYVRGVAGGNVQNGYSALNERSSMVADHQTESRVRAVQALAEHVFESRSIAFDWLARPNAALGGVTPLSCCATEAGARQVRRILRALESGGVA
jgi:uncharacterized protein (DUF2384 family)